MTGIVVMFMVGRVAAADDPRAKCDHARIAKVAAAAGKFLKCYARSIKKGTAESPGCATTLAEALRNSHGSYPPSECTSTGADDQYVLTVQANIQGLADTARTSLVPSAAPSKCAAKKLLALNRRTKKVLKTFGSAIGGAGYGEFVDVSASLNDTIAADFGKAELGTDCQTTGDASALSALAQAYLAKMLSVENRCEVISANEFSQLAYGSWLDVLTFAQDQGYLLTGQATVCPSRALQLLGAPMSRGVASLIQVSTGNRATLMVGPVAGEAFVVEPGSNGSVILRGPSGELEVAANGTIVSTGVLAAAAGPGLGECAAWFDACIADAQFRFARVEIAAVIAAGLYSPFVPFAYAVFLADSAHFLEEVKSCAEEPPSCTLPGGGNLCATGRCAGFSWCVPEQAINEDGGCGPRQCIAGFAASPVLAEAVCNNGSCRYRLATDCSQSPSPMHCDEASATCVPGPGSMPPPSDCTTAQTVVGLSPGSVASINAGRFHTCAVTADGEVKCWGRNAGRLGDGTATDSSVPVTPLASGAIKVAAGGGHTCALMQTGTVKCWGLNNNGQLGNGTQTPSLVPVDVLGLSDAIDVAVGNHHTCALTAAHEVRCWGGDEVGQLGGTCDNNGGACGGCCIPGSPVAGIADATALALGRGFSCARTGLGLSSLVYCWGSNPHGETGRGNQLGCALPSSFCDPALVCSAPNCEPFFDFDVLGLAAGGWDHACTIDADPMNAYYKISCWGLNSSGQIGDGTTVDALWATTGTSIQEAFAISDLSNRLALGQTHTCALTPFGVVCWGDNSLYQLGDGTNISHATPVAVSALSPYPIPSAISAGGGQHTCAIRGPLVECWGDDAFGQLGNGRIGCGP